jgi:hypothetical protein
MGAKRMAVRVGLCVGVLASARCGDGGPKKPALPGAQAAGSYLGPAFPGAGTSGAGQSIAAGLDTVTCDGSAAPGGTQGPAAGSDATMTCLFGEDPNVPEATVEWIVESAADTELVHVRLTLNPAFCDNTYGATAIGWEPAAAAVPAAGPGKAPKPKGGKGGHTFKDLVGSDHAEFKLSDANGALRLQFKLDYITESADAASGYATLGVTGGEGKMILGDASDVVAASTSLDRNLNACGMAGYTVDSPATDADYTANADAPRWDYRVVYDVWVTQSAFGAGGFGSGTVDFVHASPSKRGTNTVVVTPGPCPPNWPPYCADPAGCCDDPDGCDRAPGEVDGGVPTEPPADSDAGCDDPDGCDRGAGGFSPDAGTRDAGDTYVP